MASHAWAQDVYFTGPQDIKVLPPRPVEYEATIVKAQVHAAPGASGVVDVVFAVDGEVHSRLNLAVTSGKAVEALFRWEPQTSGTHRLKISLDPDRKPDESDPANHQVIVKVEVDPLDNQGGAPAKKKKTVYPYYPF